MNINRILCPVDFSVFNSAANEYACTLAQTTGAEIVYFHSWLLNVYETPPEFFDAEAETRRLERDIEEFIQPTDDKIKFRYVIEIGSPSDRIVEYANENDVDLIVMGTHGRTGLKRMVMGSVAESVVRKASCPVLAIKSETKVPQNA